MAKIKLSGNEIYETTREKAEILLQLKKYSKPGEMIEINNKYIEIRDVKRIDLEDRQAINYNHLDLERNLYYRAKGVMICRKNSKHDDLEKWIPKWDNVTKTAIIKDDLREEFTRDFERTCKYSGVKFLNQKND